MNKLFLAAAIGLSMNLGVPAQAARPLTVFEDPSDDADNGHGLGYSLPGGFDLVSGSLMRDGDDLVFTVRHAEMPSTGSIPEGFRFMWAFSSGQHQYRITVKRADIGKPDVVQGQTTERLGRIDLDGHFRLEGECSIADTNSVDCRPLAYVEGEWSPVDRSFSVLVPLTLIKARGGTLIAQGRGDGAALCPICWVSHVAERSSGATVIDEAVSTVRYRVPKK